MVVPLGWAILSSLAGCHIDKVGHGPSPAHVAPAPATTSLPISTEPDDEARPEKESATLLHPETCSVTKGRVTATGTLASDVPESYRRIGAFLVLHVYGPADAGKVREELADLKHQTGHVWRDSLSLYGSAGDSWTVTAPVDLKAGTPTSCEISVERLQPFIFRGAPG
jgi:hypothetical protein